MVCEWGMSDKMGPLSYGKKEEQIFLVGSLPLIRITVKIRQKTLMRKVVLIVSRNYEKAKKILTDHIEYCIR